MANYFFNKTPSKFGRRNYNTESLASEQKYVRKAQALKYKSELFDTKKLFILRNVRKLWDFSNKVNPYRNFHKIVADLKQDSHSRSQQSMYEPKNKD